MHRLIVILFLVALAAAVAADEQPAAFRVNEHERGPQLIGEVGREDIVSQFPDWDAEYPEYEPVPDAVAALVAVEAPVDIVCVLGTWCHDSEREVPRFWKVLDTVGNPNLGLTMYAVGRTADEDARIVEAELGFEDSLREIWEVEFVPTFVFLRDGKEFGRIVETPETTLEEDAAALLAEAPAAPTWR